jgi:WD repeat-containing protein mio
MLGYSLIVWDLESTILKFNTSSVPRSPSIPSQSDRHSPRIVCHSASAEVVSTVSFLPTSPSLLVAGVGRFLRLYDLRTPTVAPPSVPAKASQLAPDPYDPNRLACAGDGTLSVWDLRRLSIPVLLFNNADARGDGALYSSRSSGHSTPHPQTAIEWSRSRRGLLASLHRDDSHVRFWDIQEVPPETTHSGYGTPRSISRESSVGRSPRLSWTGAAGIVASWSSASPTQPVTVGRDGPAQNLVLTNTFRSLFILYVYTTNC